jgi:hypothetical protein
VAKYFLLIGTAALQALPLLLAKGYANNHPLLQHPAINNPDYKAYAQQQLRCVRRLEGIWQLCQTPVMGPVFSMVAGDQGVVSSAECTEQERSDMLVNGCTAFAVAATTASSVAVGSGLNDGTHFMLVSTAEMHQLLQQRAAQRAKQAESTADVAAAADAAAPAAAGVEGLAAEGQEAAAAAAQQAASAGQEAAAPVTNAQASASAAASSAAGNTPTACPVDAAGGEAGALSGEADLAATLAAAAGVPKDTADVFARIEHCMVSGQCCEWALTAV